MAMDTLVHSLTSPMLFWDVLFYGAIAWSAGALVVMVIVQHYYAQMSVAAAAKVHVWLVYGRAWHAPLVHALVTRVRTALLADERAHVTVTEWVLPEGAGIYEVPQELAHRLSPRAQAPLPDAVIALGVVVQGGSKHDEDVAYAAAHGFLQLGIQHQMPVVWGVVHAGSVAAAEARTTGSECAGEAYATLAVSQALARAAPLM
jgi:6,7-dimethyl-8-ribityllumazine synthase